MILFLNTADFDTLYFAWIDPDAGKARDQKLPFKYAESEKTAGYLDRFLSKDKNWRDKLEKIIVVSGPGSFTGIRTGISLALAISLVLDIEVFAIEKPKLPKKIAELAQFKKSAFKKVSGRFKPDYGAEPNITIKKTR